MNFVVIQRLGKFHKISYKGIHLKIPFIDAIILKDNLKEKVFDFPAQHTITRDNATIKVDTVVYLKIVNPKLYAYGAERPLVAIESLVATTLRNLIGELQLDESLTSREVVNEKLTLTLDIASDPWGIKVNRVEIQNIVPPREVQEAMTRQMQSERDKRARILEAEGIKQSQILEAQGLKESLILKAQAEKEKTILDAQAIREREILIAQGKQEAIKLVANADLNDKYLRFKSLEQIGVLANGTATKIILPPDLNSVAKDMAVASAIITENNEKEKSK